MALVVLLLLLLLEAHLSLHSARGDVITTQPTVLTTVGEDARLTCRLTVPSEDILQVTWQKEKDGSSGQWDNIASYSNFFGIRVQPPFVGRLAFGEDSPVQLWNSSIVFRDVRQEDQSCYKCLFSGHPDGVLTANTCLRVSEPPESTSPSPDSRHDGDTTTVQKKEGPSALTMEPPLTDRNYQITAIIVSIFILVVVAVAVGVVVVFIKHRKSRSAPHCFW